jgi:drug/metabolite transporter (DMT)-like permease
LIYLYQRYSLVREYGSIQASPGMQNAVKEGMKTDINPLLFAIPMLCDSGASALLLIAYINLPASITQMMGGFVVFIVAMMSIIFLKRKLYRHHWTGLFLLFSGIGLVALSVLVGSDKKDNPNENPILGIPLMIVSILIQGVQFIVEEKLLGSYYLNPMKVVGWEGITG